jgi:hypothetical protein
VPAGLRARLGVCLAGLLAPRRAAYAGAGLPWRAGREVLRGVRGSVRIALGGARAHV